MEASCCEQDAMQYPQKQHANKGDGGGGEVQPADAPHAEQRRKIQEPCYRGHHHRSQDRLGQVLQQPREKERGRAQV